QRQRQGREQFPVADENHPAFIPRRRDRQATHLRILPLFARLCGAAAKRATLALVRAARHLVVTVDETVADIEWRVSTAPVPYEEALGFMEERAAAIRAGTARECIWLLEHPPLFTAGPSANPAELFNPLGFPVYDAGRG